MKITIIPTALGGSIQAPASKSITHRYLICAALAKTPSIIKLPLYSHDTLYTIAALKQIGVQFVECEDELHIIPPQTWQAPKEPIECGNSGSTARFLIPLLGLLFHQFSLTGNPRLWDRLEQTGLIEIANYQRNNPILTINFLMQSSFTVTSAKTTQYISGLLFASIVCANPITIHIIKPSAELDPYIQLTLWTIEQFGVHFMVEQDDTNCYIRTTPQSLALGGKYPIEGDYSAASNLLTMGMLGIATEVNHLIYPSVQGDAIFLSFLTKMGIPFSIKDHAVTVYPHRPKALTISLKTCPDLGPLMMGIASIAEGESILYDLEKLHYKESDRLKNTIDLLLSLGAEIQQEENSLRILGKPTLTGGQTIDIHADHRLIFLLASISSRLEHPITITHAEEVNKSYPHFWHDFQKLGGIIIQEPES